MRPASRSHGFTVVELLVVISIIALLIALMVPSLKQARSVTKRLGCVSSLRQIQVGYATYFNDHRGYLYTFDYDLVPTYFWDETALDPYFKGGATPLFKDGCPGRGPQMPPFAADTWSYGANGSVHAYEAPPDPPYYNTSRPARIDEVRRPDKTHFFADMVGLYKRYPNHGFFDTYLLDRTYRHDNLGICAVYADGHASFEPDGPNRIWYTTWHYATSCPTNGCFWHAYRSSMP